MDHFTQFAQMLICLALGGEMKAHHVLYTKVTKPKLDVFSLAPPSPRI
jgi:hypothetical protein